jgi:putative ABC transport system ATP-binding protein
MISVKNIKKSYKAGLGKTTVLDGITFDIEEGEFVSIMGPSGSGKSTLLHILGMLDTPSSGIYDFVGESVFDLNDRKRSALHREYIGFIFQAYHLLEDLTVYENLETPLLYKKVKRADRKGMIAEMLDRFNLVAKKDLFPAQLSGGQQQVVGVARALVISPKLILADEPTGNLHSSQGDVVMSLLRELNERDGVTVIQVTHNKDYADIGHRIIELLDGQVDSDRVSERSKELGRMSVEIAE